MIINDKGQTVWFKATPRQDPSDFRVQQLGGKPVLTWWRASCSSATVTASARSTTPTTTASRRSPPATATRSTCTSSRSAPQNTRHRARLRALQRDLRPWGRPEGLARRGQHRPGDRPQAPARGAVRVALASATSGSTSPTSRRRPPRLRVGVLPRQLGRDHAGRQLPDLRAQHLDDLPRSIAAPAGHIQWRSKVQSGSVASGSEDEG